MKPEIKQRIEQIKAGQVPDGYKRTKAGVVPVEWEEKRIGDVLTQRKTLMLSARMASPAAFLMSLGMSIKTFPLWIMVTSLLSLVL